MSGKYSAFGLYSDSEDPRLIVPKRIPGLGWTINVGHRFGMIALAAFCSAIAIIILAAIRYG